MNEQDYRSPIRCDLCGRIGARWDEAEGLWLCADGEACLSRYLAEERWGLPGLPGPEYKSGDGLAWEGR